ncbi:hypothetical protein Agub_g10908 [Astrephomene gubernaculifera]|uniref:Uncharacterized protein n=1 Tax=Astrephomene gubernaculifera TaxID=47775 RepID=A0AAD3DXQ6_9CHLO|nr:hypothetical protein Agub_g10908 [Astrephomene gubernaculifera]
MGDIRPRHLVFEDLSEVLARASGPGMGITRGQGDQSGKDMPLSMRELNEQLASLASNVQEAHGALQERFDVHRKAALDQIAATGGKRALENQLKSQKANLKIVGQKEAFLERIKEHRSPQDLLQHDFSSDVPIANTAVQALKEQIRERNASIGKIEQQMAGFIQQITAYYDSGNNLARQLGQQLPRIKVELEEYQATQLEHPEPTAAGMSEDELLKLLAAEEETAARLEQEAARDAANWAEEQAEYAAVEASLQQMREVVASMEEECDAAAKKQGAKYAELLNRQEALGTVLSRITGVELEGTGPTSVHLTITQAIPRNMPGREQHSLTSLRGSAGGEAGSSSQDPRVSAADVVMAEHVLTLEFEAPGSTLLRTASLNPPGIDVEGDVRAARAVQDAGGKDASYALSMLLLDVKGRIRSQCRRQLQLEDAHEVYPMQPTSVSPELLRCALPNKVEVEVEVPLWWPEEPGTRLRLVQMQGPRASQDLAPLLARLQRELEEALQPADRSGGNGGVQAELRRRQLQGCSLRELLDWVYENVQKEEKS